jgi:hypothetical protein
MPTSVHIPEQLLEAIDRRASALKVSRNRFIVQTLERALSDRRTWSPGFFDALEDIDPDDARAVDDMVKDVLAARRSKRPPRL